MCLELLPKCCQGVAKVLSVTMFVSRLSAFSERNGLSEECVGELVELFNAALVEVGQGILRDTGGKGKGVGNGDVGGKGKGNGKGSGDVQRWASRVAETFATEKGLTLDDFPDVLKVTKQHMLDHIKAQRGTGDGVGKGSPADSVASGGEASGKAGGKAGRKVHCNGMTNKGEPCTRTGTIFPEGAANCYCFRHADQWRDFETTVSSDSDSDVDDEEDEFGDKTVLGEEPIEE